MNLFIYIYKGGERMEKQKNLLQRGRLVSKCTICLSIAQSIYELYFKDKNGYNIVVYDRPVFLYTTQKENLAVADQ